LSLRSLQGQGGDFDLGCIPHLGQIKFPSLSQKTRQGRGTLDNTGGQTERSLFFGLVDLRTVCPRFCPQFPILVVFLV
jgi:hypothetical protein